MESSQPNRHFWFICLGLVIITAGIYGAALNHEFITFDDPDYVTQNPHAQNGLTWRGVTWAFTTGHASNWHPLTWVSHMLDCQVYGLNPAGHHFTNLLLHLANTVLLFAALWRMTGATWRSGLVAALFAWHPLHIESVAWVAERKDVLCAFFWMLGLHAYAGYAKQPAWRGYALTLLCFAAGLLSKPMMVTFPCVLLLLDLWPLRRIRANAATSTEAGVATRACSWRFLLLEKIPFFLLTAGASWATFRVQRQSGAVISLEHLSALQRTENAAVSLVGYLRKMVWPHDLAVFYPHPHVFPVGLVVGSGLLLATVTVVAAVLWRRQAYLLVGWLWFLGTLFPVIGLVQVGAQGMADRYTYLPLVGVFIAIVWGLAELAARWPAGGLVGRSAAALALAGCLVLTGRQLRTWQDSLTLFSHSLSVTPDNFLARGNLGNALDKLGRSEEAVANFEKAAELEPRAPYAFNNLGWHYERAGKLEKAMEYYQTALRVQPNFLLGHYNLARLLTNQGRLEEAAQHYTECLRQDPDDPNVQYLIGAIFVRLDRLDLALGHFKAALRNKPHYPEVHSQLGGLFQKLGHSDAALTHYAEAIRLKPDYAHAHLKLGLLLAQQMQFEQAKPHLTRAIQLEPTNDAAFYNIAGVFQAQGQWESAATAFAAVVRLKPDDTDARSRLGDVLAQAGKFEAAITQYREAIRLQPDAPRTLGTLAAILATNPRPELRNAAEAIRLAERANELTSRKDLALLTILDQSYAEAGRFEDAIKTAQQVQALAQDAQQPALAEKAARRLESYRAGKPDHG